MEFTSLPDVVIVVGHFALWLHVHPYSFHPLALVVAGSFAKALSLVRFIYSGVCLCSAASARLFLHAASSGGFRNPRIGHLGVESETLAGAQLSD